MEMGTGTLLGSCSVPGSQILGGVGQGWMQVGVLGCGAFTRLPQPHEGDQTDLPKLFCSCCTRDTPNPQHNGRKMQDLEHPCGILSPFAAGWGGQHPLGCDQAGQPLGDIKPASPRTKPAHPHGLGV